MKNRMLILIILVISGLFVHAQENLSDKPFYYYKGEKFYLEVDYSRITVISEGKLNTKIESKSVFSIKNESKSCTKQSIVLLDEITEMVQDKENFITEIEFTELLKRSDYYGIIQQFSKENDVVRVMPTYITSGQKLGISNNFYVKLFKKEDEDNLFELAKKYSVQVLGYNEFMPLWFTLSCNRGTSLDAIDAANIFYETGLFECTEPELLYHNLRASNGPYFSNQWGLKNTGQHCNTSNIDIRAEDAWNITKGSSNIRVAVFDNGIKMDHPDLINNIYGTGYDAETNTTPSVLRGDHGTPCAGIIGAEQNNTKGLSGIAPGVKLIPISINLDGNNTPQQLANGFNWAWQNGADVISNSWGGYAPSSIIDNAIINTLTHGRNGKGTVVVFASGNEDNTNIRYPGNSNPDILVVGAITPDGGRKSNNSCDGGWWGSCYGTQLDVVAPGVFIPTTTYTGGYTQTFDGTSSACPHVAGIAALILSVRPDLTQAQVRNAIESSCTKLPAYNFVNNSSHPNSTWNNEVGHGLVDAYAAVSTALFGGIVSISGPNIIGQAACQSTYTLNNYPPNITNVVWSCDAPLNEGSDQGTLGATFERLNTGHTPSLMLYEGWSTQNQPMSFSHPDAYTIQLSVSDACGTIHVGSLNFTVLGLPLFPFAISFSPNPVSDELSIDFEQLPQTDQTETYWVKLLDRQGKIQRETKFKHQRKPMKAKSVKFNTSSLPTGTYFLHVEGAGKVQREQIVKN